MQRKGMRRSATQLFHTFMTHIIQSMKRSYLFEEIVQTMRRYIAVNMHTAHYFRNSFHFDQGGGKSDS